MKDILEYTSYRQYIADYYADKKAKRQSPHLLGRSSPVRQGFLRRSTLNT